MAIVSPFVWWASVFQTESGKRLSYSKSKHSRLFADCKESQQNCLSTVYTHLGPPHPSSYDGDRWGRYKTKTTQKSNGREIWFRDVRNDKYSFTSASQRINAHKTIFTFTSVFIMSFSCSTDDSAHALQCSMQSFVRMWFWATTYGSWDRFELKIIFKNPNLLLKDRAVFKHAIYCLRWTMFWFVVP